MGDALYVFGWSERQFWNATPHVYFATLESHQRYNQPPDKSRTPKLSVEDVRELKVGLERALEKERRDHAAMKANGRKDG